jgi:hypothetical protein
MQDMVVWRLKFCDGAHGQHGSPRHPRHKKSANWRRSKCAPPSVIDHEGYIFTPLSLRSSGRSAQSHAPANDQVTEALARLSPTA